VRWLFVFQVVLRVSVTVGFSVLDLISGCEEKSLGCWILVRVLCKFVLLSRPPFTQARMSLLINVVRFMVVTLSFGSVLESPNKVLEQSKRLDKVPLRSDRN
jgi:hypothetical protein